MKRALYGSTLPEYNRPSLFIHLRPPLNHTTGRLGMKLPKHGRVVLTLRIMLTVPECRSVESAVKTQNDLQSRCASR